MKFLLLGTAATAAYAVPMRLAPIMEEKAAPAVINSATITKQTKKSLAWKCYKGSSFGDGSRGTLNFFAPGEDAWTYASLLGCEFIDFTRLNNYIHLTCLDLSGSKVENFNQLQLKNLKYINLSKTYVTHPKESTAKTADLKKNVELFELALFGDNSNNPGLSKKLSHLQELNLSGTIVESVSALLGLVHLKNLQTLTLSSRSKVNKLFVLYLQLWIPKLKIVYTDEASAVKVAEFCPK